MFALRTQRWLGQHNPSGEPDGMFIRASDSLFTDNKASAMLFDTGIEAEAFVEQWYKDFPGGNNGRTEDGQVIPLFLVEVETKPVIQKVGKLCVTFYPDRLKVPK
jgi:hypothetical protein